jgi:hypothetical protein
LQNAWPRGSATHRSWASYAFRRESRETCTLASMGGATPSFRGESNIFWGDAERSDLISDVRHRFTLIEAVLRGEPIEPVAESRAFLESLSLCQLIARHARYYLLVIVVRNLENPRESFLLEIYFETGESLVFPLTLLREQAEAAKILVQEFDSWFVELPTLDEFVKGV